MGILDNLERGLERAVNGAFAKTFRAGLQPVELTSALRKEIDTHTVSTGRDLVLAPHNFRIRMAPNDYEHMLSLGVELTDELVSYTSDYGRSQNYYFTDELTITLINDPTLTVGMVQVESDEVTTDIEWIPILEINGHRHALRHSRTVIGRGSDADIVVSDSGISRKHVLISWDGNRAQVEDLGSTNGSQLDGIPVKKSLLEPGSTITIGHSSIIFRIVPTPRAFSTPEESYRGGFSS